jgi:hypothetical protein
MPPTIWEQILLEVVTGFMGCLGDHLSSISGWAIEPICTNDFSIFGQR